MYGVPSQKNQPEKFLFFFLFLFFCCCCRSGPQGILFIHTRCTGYPLKGRLPDPRGTM